MAEELSPEKRALLRAAELLGGQAAFASVLGYSDRRNVSPWFTTDRRFPAEHCPAIERATKGAVRCEDLRPDVAWSVLREQVAPSDTKAAATLTQPEADAITHSACSRGRGERPDNHREER